jgi:hypothetical protein
MIIIVISLNSSVMYPSVFKSEHRVFKSEHQAQYD